MRKTNVSKNKIIKKGTVLKMGNEWLENLLELLVTQIKELEKRNSILEFEATYYRSENERLRDEMCAMEEGEEDNG